MANTAEILQSNVLTGGDNHQKYLYYQLRQSIAAAKGIDIIVSFLMESGVRMLLEPLKVAQARGARIRILTGNYLGITQPSALYLVKQALGSKAELRFYTEENRSFHPKSYLFHFKDHDEIYIGSSNVSRSALTSGIEWNYRFSSRTDPESYNEFYHTFEDLFLNHAFVLDDEELRRYSRNWHCPAAIRELDQYDRGGNRSEAEDSRVQNLFTPRGAQIEALCALENTRAEGATRALVMAATGVGKTYLAAFDSRPYSRVLFVAHRDEILQQAAQSFHNVRKSEDYGFFTGTVKNVGRSVIFASVATLGRAEYLTRRFFAPDYFQYIVVDEFHHAVTQQYKRILDYFKPQFMLGLTATPERMDGRSIYELCDYNVAYEISLKEAINKGMLVPFRYYGIYDDTDYSHLHLVHGRYDEKELNETYIGNVHRHDLIYKYFCKYAPGRALGFCCSRAHAEEMAGEFSRRGIPSAAVYSNADGLFSADRADAIEHLKSGDIRVIFSVDMFNEGVDIPNVDMVMFLRPTESPVVFLQQLGRGLRKSAGKEYLTVLDFIGNYEKAGNVRSFLAGHSVAGRSPERPLEAEDIPDGCMIDFDMRLIDLFRKLDSRNIKVKDRIYAEYCRIRSELGHRPTRLELFTQMEDAVYISALSHTKDNPFRDYLGYLQAHGELTEEENALFSTPGREFLNLIETTSMSKVYKMPVLEAFYNHGRVRMQLTAAQLLAGWKQFFDKDTNWKDLDKGITLSSYRRITDAAHLRKILSMPVHFLLSSGKGFFTSSDEFPIALCNDLAKVASMPSFADHMRDIIEYREMDYYQRRYAAKYRESVPEPELKAEADLPDDTSTSEPAAESSQTADTKQTVPMRTVPGPYESSALKSHTEESIPLSSGDLNAAEENIVWLPIVGEIAAGCGRVTDENILGYLPVSRKKLHPAVHGKYFYLLVDGDSMINAGIHSGDAVLIRQSSVPKDGDIIAARYDGDRGTLKTLYRGPEVITLQPENDAYSPIIVPLSDFENGTAGYSGVAVPGENIADAMRAAKDIAEIDSAKIL